MYEFKPATVDMIPEIMEMVQEDILKELDALVPCSREQAIKMTLEKAIESWAAYHNGKLKAVFGFTKRSVVSDDAVVWLFTSKDIHKHIRQMFICAPLVFPYWAKKYNLSAFQNYIPFGFSKLLRFVEKIGFSVSDPISSGGSTPYHLVRLEMR